MTFRVILLSRGYSMKKIKDIIHSNMRTIKKWKLENELGINTGVGERNFIG